MEKTAHLREPYKKRSFLEQYKSKCIMWFSTLQTLCPHPTNGNSDLDSQYLPRGVGPPHSTCDLCNADDIQDEQHALFHRTHPHMVSFRMTYASMFHPAGFNNVFAFLSQNNNRL